MAVTTHESPEARSPVYSPQIFLALSSQIAQPNFFYRVILTDLISGDTQTFDCDPDPSGYLRFDAGPFAESFFTSQYIPMNTYGWQKSTGIRKIRINIGESYGSTPAYYAGSNSDWIVWNAVETYEQYPSFDITDYLYDVTVPNYVYLTSSYTTKAYADKSDYLYVLSKGAGDLKRLVVKTYDLAGVNDGIFFIDNPYESSTTYTDKYLCIDVGIKGLTNISSGLVTVNAGALPIIKATTGSYIVYECNPSGPGDPPLRQIKRYTIGCEPVYDIYTLHFLRRNGSFETIHFNKRSDFVIDKDETTWKSYPYKRVSNTYTYSRSTPLTRVLSTKTTETLKLNTDWLTSAQVDLYTELFDSPLVYLDNGSTLDYSVVRPVPSSYKRNKAWNEPMYSLQMDFVYAHSNFRQRV